MVALAINAACQDDHSDRLELPIVTHDVTLSQIHQRTLPIVYSTPGVVVPIERLQVASRISGFIEKIYVDEGDRVEVGVPLVDIDEAQVQAMIRAADAALAFAQAERLDAAEDMKRYEGLTRSKTLAEDQLRDARVRLAQAKAQVEKAQAELDAQRQDARYTRLISPVRALVRERLHDPGDMVTVSEPILRLEKLGAMEFEVFVPSTQVHAVAEGQRVEVELDSANEPITGHVIRVVHSADPVTRRYKVRIALPDSHYLMPGQFGRAHLVVGEESAVIIVPHAAVATRAGIKGVYVIDEESKARFRSVRLGRRWTTDRELLAGVEVGNKIIVQPPSLLRDGDRVRQVASYEP